MEGLELIVPGSWALVVAAASCFVLATYAGYPAFVILRSKLQPRPGRVPRRRLPTVSCIVAAHDEGERLVRKVENLLGCNYPPGLLEVIVADDASTDGSGLSARALNPARVRLSQLPVRAGKAAAIQAAASVASGEILVLCDSRQRFDRKAIRELVGPLSDPSVGAVSGELQLEELKGPGMYWRYELAIRKAEGRVDSVVGATGAIYAVRRSLFPRLPPETILDDVFVPMSVVLAGRRVVFAERAHAFDAELGVRQEFRRKVRTLAGNYQLPLLLPALLSPFHNRLFFAFFWHKLARLGCPWALAAILVGSVIADGALFDLLFGLQALAYVLAGWGFLREGRCGRLPALCATFVTLNAAAVAGLVQFGSGQASVTWSPTGARPATGALGTAGEPQAPSRP